MTEPRRILGIAGLLVGLAIQPLEAQERQPGASIAVPPGGKLRATLGEAKAEVGVLSRAGLVELRFGRVEGGRFVPYGPKQPIAWDRPFLVQARFASEPPWEQTTITLSTQAGGSYTVPVFKTAARPDVFQSPAMVFEDPSGCRGLKFCKP